MMGQKKGSPVEVLANPLVAIILRYVSIFNQHMVHLKFTQCYVNYISMKLEKEKKKKVTPQWDKGSRVHCLFRKL